MEKKASIFLIARPGRMRDGLRAMIKAMPQLALIGQADNAHSAWDIIIEQPPALILLDATVSLSEIQPLIEKTKIRWPEIQFVVLVNDQQHLWSAQSAGVDRVLLTGFSISQFFTAIEELLAPLKSETSNSFQM